ncbi:MAG: helix-turn-helix transcriptional regulator [Clostridia bacterium]|nr:helix-turn-helix transcriptional regulator [Clostridia bacterium]
MSVCKLTISEKIKDYRAQNRLSQGAFGQRVGVSAQAVSKWEKELCYPDITILPSLAALIGCSIGDFFDIR